MQQGQNLKQLTGNAKLLWLAPLLVPVLLLCIRYIPYTVHSRARSSFSAGVIPALAREIRLHPWAQRYEIEFNEWNGLLVMTGHGYQGYLTYDKTAGTLIYEETALMNIRSDWRQHGTNYVSRWTSVTNQAIFQTAAHDKKDNYSWRKQLDMFGAHQEPGHYTQ